MGSLTLKKSAKSSLTRKVPALLAKEPGLSIKDIATKFRQNRQFMAGFLAALEERGEISCRNVGPARIYFAQGVAEVARTPSGRGPQ